jgi:hypothetical protein
MYGMLAAWMTWTAALASPWSLSEDGTRVMGSGTPDEGIALPCAGRSVLARDDDAWVACADAVVRVRRDDGHTWAVDGVFPVDGEVVDLFEREGEVWAVRQRLDAIPVAGQARAPVDGPRVVGGASRVAVGAVTGLDHDRPVINLGRQDGLEPGDRVEFYQEHVRSTAAGDVVEEQVIALGVVVGASGDAAIVAPGINQFAAIGTLARPTERTMGANTAAPPRVPGQGWIRLNTAGLVSISDAGGGLVFDGAIGYRFKPPIEVSLRVGPGWAGGRAGVLSGRATFVGMLAFDHPYFAIGVGGGVSVVEETVTGVFAQMVRLGAVDGLGLTAVTQFAKGPAGTRWTLDGVDGVIQIPLSRKAPATWLTLHGRGSSVDGGGDLGVRIRARGNGQRGTLTFWPHVGALAVHNWVGPAMGLGLDVRL